MTIAAWPADMEYSLSDSGFSAELFLKPISSEMDGGNLRQRGRPGDEVQVVQQTIGVWKQDFAQTLKPFLLANRGRRVLMPVLIEEDLTNCVAMIVDPRVVRRTLSRVDVSMTVRVLRAVVPLAIAGTPVLTATHDVAYAGFQVAASGGVPGYSYSIHSGTLPAGLSLNADTGVVSGTPTGAGVSAGIVIRVTDDAGSHVDLDPFTLTVG
jgi:hypothetical protein